MQLKLENNASACLLVRVAARRQKKIWSIKLSARRLLEDRTKARSGWAFAIGSPSPRASFLLQALVFHASSGTLSDFAKQTGARGMDSLMKRSAGLLLMLLSPRKSYFRVCFRNARNSWTFAEVKTRRVDWCALNRNTYFQTCKCCSFHPTIDKNVSSLCSLMNIFSLAISYCSLQRYKSQVLENNYAEQYRRARTIFLLFLMPS